MDGRSFYLLRNRTITIQNDAAGLPTENALAKKRRVSSKKS